jgi:D-alanyl-D-alanine dipeptidase
MAVRAVKAFMAWVQNPNAPTDGRFWPRTRADLIKDAYVAANSVHSRGAAIDLTLTTLPLAPKPKPKADSKLDFGAEPKVDYGPCNGPNVSSTTALIWGRPSTVSTQ